MVSTPLDAFDLRGKQIKDAYFTYGSVSKSDLKIEFTDGTNVIIGIAAGECELTGKEFPLPEVEIRKVV